MDKIWRHRSGYLWTTDEESELIDKLIKSSGIYKSNEAINTRADFIRVATMALGKLLKKRRPAIRSDFSQEEVIDSIVSCFSR